MAPGSLDDVLELGLQRSTADKEAVDIGLTNELSAVAAVHRATIKDAGFAGDVTGDVLTKPLTDFEVGVLSLLRSGNLASADGPDGLVSNDDIGPVGLVELIGAGLELAGVDLTGLARLALLELLTDAEHDGHALVDGGLGLDGNIFVGLVEEGTSLRVTGKGPADAEVLHLTSGDVTGVSSEAILGHVLGGNVDVVLDLIKSGVQVDIGGSNDDRHLLGVVLSLVQGLFGEGVDERDVTVGLPVATDDVLTLNIAPATFSRLGNSVHGEGGTSIPVATVHDAEAAGSDTAGECSSGGSSGVGGLLHEVLDDAAGQVGDTLHAEVCVISLGLGLREVTSGNGGLKWRVDHSLKRGSSSSLGGSEAVNIAHAGSLALNGGVVVLGGERLRILNIFGGRHNKGIIILDGLTCGLDFEGRGNVLLGRHVERLLVDAVGDVHGLVGHHGSGTGLGNVLAQGALHSGGSDAGADGASDSEESVLSVVL